MRSADRSCTVSRDHRDRRVRKLGQTPFLVNFQGIFSNFVRLSFRKFNLNLLQINLHVVNSEFGERVRGWKLDHDD